MMIHGSNEQMQVRGNRTGVAFKGAEWMRIRELLVESNTPVDAMVWPRIPEFISPELSIGLFFDRTEWGVIQIAVSEFGDVPDYDLAEKVLFIVRTYG
jgi:hypothetical protein